MKSKEEIEERINLLEWIIQQESKRESPDQSTIDNYLIRYYELNWVLGYYDIKTK